MNSTIRRIRRRMEGPEVQTSIVNVLKNDEGLADGLVSMDENRDLISCRQDWIGEEAGS
jgi:hypothetical protein